MTPFEYALGLFSVMMALALGEIALKVHRLVRHYRTIAWDGRVILSSLLVVVVTVRMWFALWTIRGVGAVLVFPFYLSLFVELMVLFLLAASVLPDDPPEDCDLSSFYERNQRALWTIFVLFQLSFFAHGLYFGAGESYWWLARVLMPLAAYALLARFRIKWLHYVLPAALIAGELASNWNRTLVAVP